MRLITINKLMHSSGEAAHLTPLTFTKNVQCMNSAVMETPGSIKLYAELSIDMPSACFIHCTNLLMQFSCLAVCGLVYLHVIRDNQDSSSK